MSRTRYRIFEDTHPHFLTCTIVGWLPVFTRPSAVNVIFDSWRFLRDQGRLEIYGYVILENHLHLIASSGDLSKEIGDFKSYSARRILDLLIEARAAMLLEQLKSHKARHKTDRVYQLGQEGSHPQQMQSPLMMKQELDYLHRNPVARGYVDEPTHWRYSSARNYAGLEGLFPVYRQW